MSITLQKPITLQNTSGYHIPGSREYEDVGYAVDYGRADEVIVGAPGADDDVGQAWIYEKTGSVWARTATFQAADFTDRDASAGRFGEAVALHGNLALIGAPKQDETGQAFLYERQANGAWRPAASLPPANSESSFAAGAAFGSAVTLGTLYTDVNFAVVGAPKQNDFEGQVVIYQLYNNNWEEVQSLTPPNSLSKYAHFGHAVSLGRRYFEYSTAQSGRVWRLIVGAPQADTVGEVNAGRAFLYELQLGTSDSVRGARWYLTNTFEPPEPDLSHAYFGSAVSVSEKQVLIGAPLESPQGRQSAGRVHVFGLEADAWQHVLSLDPPDLSEDVASKGHFGYSVSSNGQAALVGAPLRSPNNKDSVGQAFLYLVQADGWLEPNPVQTYSPPNLPGEREERGRYGSAVALGDEEVVAIGAPDENPCGKDSAGRLFLFDTPRNFAFHKHAYQSSTFNNWGASNAVDGNTNGISFANSSAVTNIQSHAWWEVDLGTTRQIREIWIYAWSELFLLFNFHIMISANPLPHALDKALEEASWSEHVPGRITVQSFEVEEQQGRYVRVQLVERNYLSLAEVEVF